MGRWAVVRTADNVVTNIVEWDGVAPWSPPPGEMAVALGATWCDLGWIYDPATDTFAAPPAP